MSRILFLFSVAVVTMFIVSCQKELSVDTPDGSANTGNFKAKIDGQQWVADRAAGAYRIQGVININGISLDKKSIVITLLDSGVQTYTLDENSFTVGILVDSSLTDVTAFTTNQGINPGDAGGTVSITEIDTDKKTISGTFQFNVFRQSDNQRRVISEGSFTDIPYSTTLPPAAATDTFQVKIDNVLWKPAAIAAVSNNTPIGNVIAISATESDLSKTVGLIFPATITPGTYNLDFFGGTYIGQYSPDSNPVHAKASTSGSLTIIEHNTSTRRIKGNFSFHAEELLNPASSSELTAGYFSLTYQ